MANYKSPFVRDYIAQNPGAKPAQIFAALKEQEVSMALINKVKYLRRKPSNLTIEDLITTRKLVTDLGGLKRTHAAVDLLESLGTL